ncbi:AAA family ATPase [Vibrio breoganii]
MQNITTQTTTKKMYGNLHLSRGSEGFDAPHPWLIKRFFPLNSFGVIFGKSDSLKSFLAIDVCCSIATGKKWNEHSTTKGAIVFIAAEGQMGISRRIKAWEQVNKLNADNVFVLGHSVPIAEKTSRSDLLEAIKQIETSEQVKVNLVVFDTLSRCFTGSENCADSMNTFIRSCDEIRQKANTSVICIHHSGKDESKGSRGSSVLLGACDFEFQVKRAGKSKLTTFINKKQKDAEEAPELEFEFNTVDLGLLCEDNEPVTSLARHTNAVVKSTANRALHPVIKALRDSFNGHCSRNELREACYPYSETEPQNTTNKRFKRTLDGLLEDNLITIEQKNVRASGNDTITLKFTT